MSMRRMNKPVCTSNHCDFGAWEWVMSNVNESCHMWMSHVTYVWVMSHMNEPCHRNVWVDQCARDAIVTWHVGLSHVTYEWVMSPWHTNASFQWDLWMSPGRCARQVIAAWHVGMSRVTEEWVRVSVRAKELQFGTWEWVMSRMNESCHWNCGFARGKDMWRGTKDIYICDVARGICDMTQSCVIWLVNLWHDSSTCVIWLIHMCDMTHSHVWHDSFIRDMTHQHVTWLIHMWRGTSEWVVSYMNESCHVWMSHMPGIAAWHVGMSDATYSTIGNHPWSSFWFSNKQHYLSPEILRLRRVRQEDLKICWLYCHDSCQI